MFFTILPALRCIYTTFYRHILTPLEKEWDLAVQRQPREGETAEQIAGNNEGDGPFDLDLEVQIVGDILGEEEEEEVVDAGDANPQQPNAQPDRPAQAPEVRRQGQAEDDPRPEIRLAADQPNIPNDENNQENEPHPQGQADAAPDAAPNAAPDAEPPAVQAINRWEIRQDISTASIASTVMGALFLPTISSLMGSYLHALLPRSLTSINPPTSLQQ